MSFSLAVGEAAGGEEKAQARWRGEQAGRSAVSI
jgi:hypothetical protein